MNDDPEDDGATLAARGPAMYVSKDDLTTVEGRLRLEMAGRLIGRLWTMSDIDTAVQLWKRQGLPVDVSGDFSSDPKLKAVVAHVLRCVANEIEDRYDDE